MSLRNLLLGMACLLPLLGEQAHAATLSPSSVTLLPGQTSVVSVRNIKGSLSIQNASPGIAQTALAADSITVTAVSVGSVSVYVRDGRSTSTLKIKVNGTPMTVAPETLSLLAGESATIAITNPNGSVRASNSSSSVVQASLRNNVITLVGTAAGTATITIRDSQTTRTVAVTVSANGSTGATSTEGRLLASNCFQCHGTNGGGGFEKLIGESESEIYNELIEFSSGKEDADGIMAAHTKGYTDAQFRAIARFLAGIR